MSMLKDTRSTPSGPVALLGKRGDSITVGQVAMATDHGGRRTAWTGGAGCLIGERPSGPLGEAAKGARTGCPLPRTPRVVGEAKEGGVNGCGIVLSDCSSKYCLSTAGCSTVQRWVDPEFSLVHP